MKKLISLCALAFTFALSPVLSEASVNMYNTEAAFFQAAPALSTETFDIYPAFRTWNTASVTLHGITYNLSSYFPGNTGWILTNSSKLPGSLNALAALNIGDQRISFGAGNNVKAFGFWFGCYDVSFQIHDTVTITEANGNQATFDLTPPSNTVVYLGFTSNQGISEVRISDWPGDSSAANWYYDNVSFSKIVPEPSSILALLCEIGGMGGIIWRRRLA